MSKIKYRATINNIAISLESNSIWEFQISLMLTTDTFKSAWFAVLHFDPRTNSYCVRIFVVGRGFILPNIEFTNYGDATTYHHKLVNDF